MERALRPERFEILPDTPSSEKEFNFFLRTLENYLAVLPQEHLDKLKILINHVSPTVFEFVNDELTYASAIEALKKMYVKPTNVVFARHLLSIRKQQPGESLDQYLQALKTLGKDCDFKEVDANAHRDQYIRDSFIAGISASSIRQRILEDGTTELSAVFEKARSLEHAQKNVESFGNTDMHLNAISNERRSFIPQQQHLPQPQPQHSQQQHFQQQQLQQQSFQQPPQQPLQIQDQPAFQQSTNDSGHLNAMPDNRSNRNRINRNPNQCGNCGNAAHPRSLCPAKDKECYSCGTRGHLGKMCRKRPQSNSNAGSNGQLASVYVSQFP